MITPLKTEIEGTMATVTLCNPAKRNPIGTDTAQALVDALLTLDRSDGVQVIVLTGAGDAFSSGGDLDEFLQTVDSGATALWDTGQPWQDLYSTIPSLSKPVIARIDGPALAGGCGIVASCDFAYATERSKFGTPEIAIGLFTLFVLPGLLRVLSRRDALDLVLTGRAIDAAEALRMGLINQVLPNTEALDAAVQERAKILSKVELTTMRRARHAVASIENTGVREGLELARALRPVFMASEELRRGIRRFKSN